jgi:V/A-type H+-transporting ATPase subunit K
MNADIFQMGVGASFLLAACGSAVGTYIAGAAVIGAWKKCYMQNKPAPFVCVAYAGAPLTNIIYGYILMGALADSVNLTGYKLLFMGIFAGLAICLSAIYQARVAATAAEAYAETGQGFGGNMMLVGICETIALFTMVFTMLVA